MRRCNIFAGVLAGLLLAGMAVGGAVPAWGATPASGIMIAAVSRNESVLAGGISTGKWTPDGVAVVEPLAWLSPNGQWADLPCNYRWVTDADLGLCRAFAQSYLAEPHAYTIVSTAGFGDTLLTPPMELGNCDSFGATAPYAGAAVEDSALAASEPGQFLSPPALLPEANAGYDALFRAFAAAAPVPAARMEGVRFFHLTLDGHALVVAQRSFLDFANAGPSDASTVKLIFAMGEMERGRFHLLFWKRNETEENEQVLGTLQLKDGEQFLLTSVNTPEAQFFRAYAMQNGHLRLVFQGGGYSC
jgi:hypothetical protein